MIISKTMYGLLVVLCSFGVRYSLAFVPFVGSTRFPSGVVTEAIQPSLPRPVTSLQVVADPKKGEEQRKRGRDDQGEQDWIPSRLGGYIPNIASRIRSLSRRKPASSTAPAPAAATPKPAKSGQLLQVMSIEEYKKEVVDVKDQLVCVRFYAPWCKACKAVEGSFRRIAREYPDIKFVEVPLTRENAFLHKGLDVPSLPFGHIYDPNVGLVEERKLNKNVFGEFKRVLETYSNGECPVTYDPDGSSNYF